MYKYMEEVELNSDNGERRRQDQLERVRSIRRSERGAAAKIAAAMACSTGYSPEEGRDLMMRYQEVLREHDYLERFANLLLLRAEASALNGAALTMAGIEALARDFVSGDVYKQAIYDHPSYEGEYADAEEGAEADVVRLPGELKDFRGGSMILKIQDMERLIDTFSSLDTRYRRAYAVMADLDAVVMDGMARGEFPAWCFVPYKADGDLIFEFSHFEVDLREPDQRYRTLYVVYRYDTTVS